MNPLYPALIAAAAAWSATRGGRRDEALPGSVRASQTVPGQLYRAGVRDDFHIRYKRARIDPAKLRLKIKRKYESRLGLTGGEQVRWLAFSRLDPEETGEGFVLFEQVDNATGAFKKRPRITDYWLSAPDNQLIFKAHPWKSTSTWERKPVPPKRVVPVAPKAKRALPKLPRGRPKDHRSGFHREWVLWRDNVNKSLSKMAKEGHVWNLEHLRDWQRQNYYSGLLAEARRMPVMAGGKRYKSYNHYMAAMRKQGKPIRHPADDPNRPDPAIGFHQEILG